MRDTASTQEQADFRAELQSRVSAMTSKQREELEVTTRATFCSEHRMFFASLNV